VFGLHNAPGMPVGHFATCPGPMMAGGAIFDIDVTGRGGHGAIPEIAVDPVIVAANIATALQTIVSRNTKPTETVVVSVTQIHAGDAYNVIPQTAVLRGTARCFRNEIMVQIEANMRRIATHIAAAYGASVEMTFRILYPPLINNAAEAAFISDVAAELVGEANVDRDREPMMPSEDFSFMLNQVPGAFMNIGNGDGEGSCEVHNPGYDFNDEILPLGAALFVKLAERKLAKAG